MVARFTEIVFDATDPPALAAFWAEVLGWDGPTVDDEGEAEINDPSGALPPFLFQPTTEPKPAKNRLHLDVNPVGRPQAEELARLLALGATPVDVGQGDDQTWHVLADPEGNEFCLLRTTLE